MSIDTDALDAACTPDISRELLQKLISTINEAYARSKSHDHEEPQRPFPEVWSRTLLEEPQIDLLSFPSYKKAIAAYYNKRRKGVSAGTKPFKMTVEESGWSEARIRAQEDLSIVFRALKEKGTLKNNDLAYRFHVNHGATHTPTKGVMQKASRAARIAINGVRTGRKNRVVLTHNPAH